MVGRNVAIDDIRRSRKQGPLPEDEAISDLDDAEDALAERLDGSHYRDDILRLLFICCHPELPATQQIALALRIVSGLSVKQIARAFLVSEAAMEQRITRAKSKMAAAGWIRARRSAPRCMRARRRPTRPTGCRSICFMVRWSSCTGRWWCRSTARLG